MTQKFHEKQQGFYKMEFRVEMRNKLIRKLFFALDFPAFFFFGHELDIRGGEE